MSEIYQKRGGVPEKVALGGCTCLADLLDADSELSRAVSSRAEAVADDVAKGALRTRGFRLWRHESGQATVLEYVDNLGAAKRFAVLDAAFRSAERFYCRTTSNSFTNINLYDLGNFADRNAWKYLNIENRSDSTYKKPVPDDYTLEVMLERYGDGPLLKDNTAKRSCDGWMSYDGDTGKGYGAGTVTGVPAVRFCRRQSLDGSPCDLPTLWQMMCMFVCGDALDALDPTLASASPAYALGAERRGENVRNYTDGSTGYLYCGAYQTCSLDSQSGGTRNRRGLVSVDASVVSSVHLPQIQMVCPILELA